MFGIGQYLWRLVPGNPILRRVVASAGGRRRDMLIRCAYLGLLVLMVVVMLIEGAGSMANADLTQLTKRSGNIFWWMSHLQLALVAFLAPVFTAGAITQEKDSQTYDILLSTPLTNGQIVLGSLLSRLFFVVALLVSGIPVFSITQVFGGVAIRSIVESCGIAAATAFVCGAMAMAIAVFKVGTRRTIFSFYLVVMLYIAIPLAIESFGYLQLQHRPGVHISWFSGLNPFLALRVIFNDGKYVPPMTGDASVAGYPWIIQWYLTSPHTFYMTFMFGLSFVLVLPSIVLMRRLAQSTSTIRSLILRKIGLSTGDKTRSVRRVWANPIAWREAKTKASAARAVFLRYAFMAIGIGAAVTLVWLYATRVPANTYIASGGYDSQADRLIIVDGGEYKRMRVATGYSSGPPTQIRLRNGSLGTLADLRPGMVIECEPKNFREGQTLSVVTVRQPQTRLSADSAQRFLLAAVLVELAVILLVVTQAAASTVTREREDGTLDLLLSTPITSRYYIWGKLRGLVSFVLPLLAVPMLSMLLFIVHDVIRMIGDPQGSTEWIVFPEALLVAPGMLVIVCAFAAILGMQLSLRCKKTVVAVMSSVGIVGGVCFGLGACGVAALGNASAESLGVIAATFSPFTLVALLIAPAEVGPKLFGPMGSMVEFPHILLVIAGWVATAVYAGIVWSMYKSMVRNFDMTIRKQAS